jgi:membrane-associated phospholipid phosphatase
MRVRNAFPAAAAVLLLAACTNETTPAEPPGSAAPAGSAAVNAASPPAPAWTFGAPRAARESLAGAPRADDGAAPRDAAAAIRIAAILVAPGELQAPHPAPVVAGLADSVDETSIQRTVRWWSAGAVFRWHEVARELTARHHLNSSYSSRLFAALSVAQHDAARAAALERTTAGSAAAQASAVAHASVGVLAEVFPTERRFLEQNAMAHVAASVGTSTAAAAQAGAGAALGTAVADRMVERLRTDGAAAAREPRVERQPGKWYSTRQTLPGWSRVRPWVMDDAAQFRAPPPPPQDSAEFRRALDEVRRYSAGRSAEHLAIATHWNLGVGGISVPGAWGARAVQEARSAGWSELRTARLMAVLHMAMFDACLASSETKYHYLVPRPSMLAPDIDEPLGLPPHPSYTSGHSAFSGAAQAVLSAAFPPLADEFSALAEEASASRFFGGLHYRFDGDQGLWQGRKVGALALERHPLL